MGKSLGLDPSILLSVCQCCLCFVTSRNTVLVQYSIGRGYSNDQGEKGEREVTYSGFSSLSLTLVQYLCGACCAALHTSGPMNTRDPGEKVVSQGILY
ncbi:hypothetical protein L873DRAFT_131234 [Choiromyces venosus 120613-1]|uniref:Uncharacterized protein n=1 Tax=Choiromyces venosus 120613-1 TaxID=1336337 RepID=A0A3N4J3B5_9PEZI|nr:hypothetical protein L873DRAFT_131234 [Choiromyces venosus 120613-1]